MEKIVYSLPQKIKGSRILRVGKSISLGLFACGIIMLIIVQFSGTIVKSTPDRYWWGGYKPLEIAVSDTSVSYRDFILRQAHAQTSAIIVASRTGSAWYPINCKSAKRIKEENKVFFASEREAVEAGYRKSSTC